MTTTVTIELTDREVDYLRRRFPHTTITDPTTGGSTYATLVIDRVKDALPDPDEELVRDMLDAFYPKDENAGTYIDTGLGRNMRRVLELVRERDAS